MDDFECGGLIFNSKFDSGNLRTVELLKENEELKADYFNGLEFKLYTKPDCADTPYENGNRTWFYFTVKGGEANQVAKFYIMNLNRQAKLYGQGMQPVVKIGPLGKWERIKDKPSFQVENDNFVLGFLHRIPDNPNTLVYYAFTFPYSCAELCEFLDKLDKKFERSPKEYEYIIHRISAKASAELNSNRERIEDSDNNLSSDSNSSFLSNIESSEYDTSNSDRPEAQKIDELKKFEGDLQNEIYYYRETLVYSLQGREVYLLTITSFHGITEDSEPILENLFPQPNRKRCHIFKNKKVIFLSSRVHPGETPASFILNGFINFILDKRNPIASILRSMYIFKIVPFLNPDGVYNGMYRSDTLGQNLNRVYLNPKLETQPTIFAARKLIRFYHYGYDKREELAVTVTDKRIKNKHGASPAIKENVESQKLNEEAKQQPVNLKEGSITSIQSCSSMASSSSNNDGDTKSCLDAFEDEIDSKKSSEICLSPVHSLESSQAFLNISLGSKKKNFLKQNKLNVIKSGSCTTMKLSKFSASSAMNGGNKDQRPKSVGFNENKIGANKKLSARKELKSNTGNGNRSPMHPVILGSFQSSSNQQNSNRSSRTNKNLDLTVKTDEDRMYCSSPDEKSNLFLYIDFHGHASKKGVFMYGNHLPNVWEAVECMLLPRLMSLNCAHFHFDACNFSERNMYLKGKRDGLSKEGSGRVAMYKSIGLIKSYTLESNYNTGKIMNVLPQRAKDKTPPKITNPLAPKYTPAIFEEVGRALGPSILDLTNSNPSSRLGNSEFRTLQGLRNSLKSMEFDRNLASRCNSAGSGTKSSRPKRRMKNKSNINSNYSRPSSSHVDPLKENKALYELPSPWDLLETGPSNANNTNSINIINVSLENNPLVIMPLQTTIQQTLSNNNNIMQTNQTFTSLACASSNSSLSNALALTTTTSTTSTLVVSPISSPSVVSLLTTIGDTKTKKIASNTSFKTKKSNQTLYGKKENSTSSKKIKTFCDNQIAGTSGISEPSTSISQVPRKRIKVSQHLLHTTQLTGSTTIASKLDLLDSPNLTSSIIIPISQQIIKETEVPCCSHSLKRSNTCIKSTTIAKPVMLNASSQTTSSTAVPPSTTAIGIPGTSFVVKSVLGGFRATSSKPNAGVNPLRKSNSLPNLSKKLTFVGAPALGTTKKIKKKRIIKNETTMTGLKRKKSRVKTGWL